MVRLLAESLGMDFTDRTGIKKARIKAVPLFSSRSTTVDFFTGLRPDDLVGTDYAELKMKEISYLAQAETTPSYRQKLLTALTSRDWFFRIRVCDAAARCDTVTEAASIMGLTASGFSKRFKKVFGEPYYHWRQAQRLAEVKYELQNTAVPLKDISAKYGFYSVQHFGHAVKKYTGQPPGRLRGESQGVKNLRDDAGSKE
ncbi:MAG: AraC family transcriptional regulator [Rikenellaceae bacterium]|nr:AraC family transcriptional regulator [Rikenellaceae bacterium]